MTKLEQARILLAEHRLYVARAALAEAQAHMYAQSGPDAWAAARILRDRAYDRWIRAEKRLKEVR